MSGPDTRAREDDDVGGARAARAALCKRSHHLNAALLVLMIRRVYTGGTWPIQRKQPLLDCLPPEDVHALAAAFVDDAPTLLDVAWIVAKNGYAADVWRCCGICREMWHWIAPELSEEDAARVRREHPFWQAIINLPHGTSGETRLLRAVFSRNLVRIKTLIAWHADVNTVTKSGDAVLIWASGWGLIEVVRALLAAGAAVDAVGRDGHTALSSASYEGETEVVRALLAAGANKHLIDRWGDTAYNRASCAPFCSGSASDSPWEIRFLLERAP
jgi:hypothetical protein